MPHTRTKIMFAFLLALCALSIGAFIFLWNQMQAAVEDSVNASGQITADIENKESVAAEAHDLATAETYMPALTAYIVPSGGVTNFLSALGTLATSSGVASQIGNVGFVSAPAAAAFGATTLDVSMSVVGDWSHVNLFLKKLAAYPLGITIQNVTMNKFSDYQVRGKTVPAWSGTVEFTALAFPDKS